jgi:dipeptidyl aminopeptidase/acylaminoacyl peptidase
MAQSFGASALKLSGDPVPVATDIPGGSISWGGAQFGVSQGVIVHMRGAGATETLLQWRDRGGAVLSTLGDPAGYWELSRSHDGAHTAVSLGLDVGDIWILDNETGMKTRFTFDPADDRSPLWSPDDSRLAFVSSRVAQGEVYVRPTSGQDDASLIYSVEAQIELTDWSSDGRTIFFNTLDVNSGDDVWTLDTQTHEAKPLLSGKMDESYACLSPDGRWLAFVSNESGDRELYVQAFPEAGGRWMVSTDTGPTDANRPRWRSDGRELFYLRGGVLMAVPVTATGGTFSFGEPRKLFSVSVTSASSYFAVSKDGQRILTNELPPADRSKVGARLIQNWPALLAR